ncbi:MAG: SurA N-terminal domain-containing protein [Ferruginibacter sp.]
MPGAESLITMRDNKYDKLLNLSIVILIVSAVMLGITGYNIFFRSSGQGAAYAELKPSKQKAERAALQQEYSNTVKDLNSNFPAAGAVSPETEADRKFREMSRLRGEIDSLLKQHASEADLAIAKIKIQELQQKVAELQNRYYDADAYNKRLQVLLNTLIAADKIPATVIVPEQATPKSVMVKNTSSGPAVVTGMHLAAVSDSKKETADADEAGKIVGSFYLKNLPAKASGEVVIVVLQPDGKVVKNSVWESGTFLTGEGNKVYSRKIFFDQSGDDKQLNFSITPGKFLKGDYIMQIWYNGNMVAKMTKTLS